MFCVCVNNDVKVILLYVAAKFIFTILCKLSSRINAPGESVFARKFPGELPGTVKVNSQGTTLINQ